eukprot:TRINITY_DN7246_c0_g2_i1.p1 TRINITY_DN7246_c0_g2~~TRINITY_DN7246_c0_g2_i1.p1  ORF type:complete len:1067 (+),score=187.85 TRINITY_DN7246_c0_g2_i1:430-3201(+)
MAANGGTTAAWTYGDSTVYSGVVTENAFEKAFDVWSRMFIDPSFLRSSSRELDSVDSEFEIGKKEAAEWHMDVALRDIANPKSPLRKFRCGNKEYLKTRPNKDGKSLVQALKKFHEKHYCAPRMRLVIMGRADPNELFRMAHKSFDALEQARNKGKCQKVRPLFFDIPAFSKELGNVGKNITLFEKEPYLQLHFPLMPLKLGDRYKTMPELYIKQIFQQSGKGSLNDRLQKEGLISSLNGEVKNSLAATSLLLWFGLTEKGQKNVETIIAYFFADLKVVRRDGIEEAFLKRTKEHMQVIFDYQEDAEEPMDFVERVANSFAEDPAVKPEDVLTKGKLVDKIDLDLINKFMDDIRPDNMNIMISSKKFSKDVATNYDDVYDFHFKVESLGEDFQKRLQSELQKESYFDGFKKPSASTLESVPTKVNLTTDRTVGELPELLEDEDGAALWWLGPGTFKWPQAKIIVDVKYPISAMLSPQSQVLREIHNLIVDHAADGYLAGTEESGTNGHRKGRLAGNTFIFSGFDEHLHPYTELFLSGVKDLELARQAFEHAARKVYEDLDSGGLYDTAEGNYESVMMTGRHRADVLAEVIQDQSLINFEEYSKWVSDVYGSSDVSVIFAGNYGRARSKTTMSMIRNLLKSDGWGILSWIKNIFKFFTGKSAGPPKMPKPQQNVTTPGLRAALKPNQDLEIRGHGFRRNISQTLVVYQFGIPKPHHRVFAKILSPLVDHLVYTELRTRRQLGYEASGWMEVHNDVLELRIGLTGSKKTPDEIADLMEKQMQDITTYLEKMSQKEFDGRKIALQTSLKEPWPNLEDWADYFRDKITEKNYCFNMEEQMLKYSESKEFSSPSVLADFWKKLVAPSKTRKKIVTKLYGKKVKKPKKKYGSGASRETIDLNEVHWTQLRDVMSGMVEEWPQQYICEAK